MLSKLLMRLTLSRTLLLWLLGRLGGLKGGRIRAERLTSARRSEIARKAALARWKK